MMNIFEVFLALFFLSTICALLVLSFGAWLGYFPKISLSEIKSGFENLVSHVQSKRVGANSKFGLRGNPEYVSKNLHEKGVEDQPVIFNAVFDLDQISDLQKRTLLGGLNIFDIYNLHGESGELRMDRTSSVLGGVAFSRFGSSKIVYSIETEDGTSQDFSFVESSHVEEVRESSMPSVKCVQLGA